VDTGTRRALEAPVIALPVSAEILARAACAAERVRIAERMARGGLGFDDVQRIVRDCFAGLEPPEADGTLARWRCCSRASITVQGPGSAVTLGWRPALSASPRRAGCTADARLPDDLDPSRLAARGVHLLHRLRRHLRRHAQRR